MEHLAIPADSIYPSINPEHYMLWLKEKDPQAFKKLIGDFIEGSINSIDPMDYLLRIKERKGLESFKGLIEDVLVDEDIINFVSIEKMMDYLEVHLDSDELIKMVCNAIDDDYLFEAVVKNIEGHFYSEIASMIYHGDIDLRKLMEQIGWSDLIAILEQEGKIHKSSPKVFPVVGHKASRKIEIEL